MNLSKINKTATISLFLFAVITIIRLYHHMPWFDEAHSWIISEQLSFIDMLKYTPQEGHFPVWNIMLFPVAKFHLYPVAMQLLNWLFCFCALIILWIKAPFNNFTKICITFSFPFLAYYSIVARCYSIGILLIFILASLYKKQLEHPLIYCGLIFLCANTSLMALIPATAFGIILIFKFIQSKNFSKDYYISLLIGLITVLVILLQIYNVNFNGGYIKPKTLMLFSHTFVNNSIINVFLIVIFSIPVIKYLLKDKYSLFFISFCCFIVLLLMYKFYSLNFWHTFFVFIYLITTFWIVNVDKDEFKWRFLAILSLTLISFIYIFYIPGESSFNIVYNSKSKQLKNFIENDINLKNAVIYHNNGEMFEVLPYSYKRSYKIKNYCDISKKSDYKLYEKFKTNCSPNPIEYSMTHQDIFKQIKDKEKSPLYFLVPAKTYLDTDKALIIANGYFLYFKKYKCFEYFCFWDMEIGQTEVKW